MSKPQTITTFNLKVIKVHKRKDRSFRGYEWAEYRLTTNEASPKPVRIGFKDAKTFGIRSFEDNGESFNINLTIRAEDETPFEKLVDRLQKKASLDDITTAFVSNKGTVIGASVPTRDKDLSYAVKNEEGKWVKTKSFQKGLPLYG